MNRKVVFRRAAASEFREARDWYEARRAGLGAEFAESIEHAVSLAAQFPERSAVVHHGIRRILIRRFPYGLFFLAEEHRIVVLAVFHCARDPAVWRGRGR